MPNILSVGQSHLVDRFRTISDCNVNSCVQYDCTVYIVVQTDCCGVQEKDCYSEQTVFCGVQTDGNGVQTQDCHGQFYILVISDNY